MSRINDMIDSRLRTVRQDGRFRPIIDQVKQAAASTETTDGLLAVATRAAEDSFRGETRSYSSYTIRERAFLATAAAASEQSIHLKDLPGAGDDKTKHFFTSGVLSLEIAEKADWLLPRRWAEGVGIGTTVAIGWAKEVYDHFFATGYNKEDLKADVEGAKRPFQSEVARDA